MSNITKTYFAVDGAGDPLLGKNFILKDQYGVLADVPMTEVGNGNYTADLPEGTVWNIYDGTSPTLVAMDVLLAKLKEPIIAQGNQAHAWFGNKVFRKIAVSDVDTLQAQLEYLVSQDTSLNLAIQNLAASIASTQDTRTFVFNGRTYSVDQITVLNNFGELAIFGEDAAGSDSMRMFGVSGAVPWTVNIPGDGSWVDALRLRVDSTEEEITLNRGLVLPGLLDNLVCSMEFPSATKDMIPYIDFRYTILQSGAGTADSETATYAPVGQSVIAKQIAYFPADTVGSGNGFVSHSIRGLKAQISDCGAHIRIKIEMKLKTPSSPISKTFVTSRFVKVAGQLYPEVL